MIQKELDQITEEDLQLLKENKVLESKTIEYKKELNIQTRDEKKEFLADISSFANASGGDTIYGVIEDDGTPEEIEGLDIENIDELKGKIEGLIRDGTDPRVYVNIKDVKLSNSKIALIIRIPKSWRSPHRIIFGKDYRFFSRNSHGKYHLDVEELRTAFNLSETIIERIRRFREDRLSNIMADETPVPLEKGAKIVLHIIPINSFSPGQNYDIDKIIYSDTFRLKPIYISPEVPRYNIDGILSYGRLFEGKSQSYVLLFRKGIIEAVTSYLIDNKDKKITRKFHEEILIHSLGNYLSILKEMNVETPIFIFLTITGVKGFSMEIQGPFAQIIPPNVIDRDVLLLPEVIIENYESKPEKILKPCFDAIWNACGYSKSPNYNENDEWVPEDE